MSKEKNTEAKVEEFKMPLSVTEEVLKTAADWADETGHGVKKVKAAFTSGGMSRLMRSVEHEVAAVLHGWREHAHETGAHMLMTKEVYLKALEATHPEVGNPKPHPAALSPYKGKMGKVALGKKL